MPANSSIHQEIETIWRNEGGRIVAATARLVRDLGIAEELAQDALLAAITHWPDSGLPEKPAAWLMTTAKHRALDHLRRSRTYLDKQQQLSADLEAQQAHVVPDIADAFAAEADDTFHDDLLRLLFTACHPCLSAEARTALTLKVIGGLSTAAIARAYLLPESTIAQRIVRAKRSLSDAAVAYELPAQDAIAPRLASVLEVIYLIFNEGYAASEGQEWLRTSLMEEALRLARLLAELLPAKANVHGLLALMELQASRNQARVNAAGEVILLQDQDRSLWDAMMIRRGLVALELSQTLGGSLGFYTLQAAIAACHAQATSVEETDWARIVSIYDVLMTYFPSPVIALNRALAVSKMQGPAAGLKLVDAIANDLPSNAPMLSYHWIAATRADLLSQMGQYAEARQAYLRAAQSTQNERERHHFRNQATLMTTKVPSI